jgi:hypothetical protein
MKEASEKFSREVQQTARNSRPGSSTQTTECSDYDRLTPELAAYSSSRTATGRDKEFAQYPEREQQPNRRRGGYDSDDSMDDAPPVGRAAYDRDYDRRDREPESRRDRHGRDPRDDQRQVQDPRYQDPRVQDPRVQDPRSYQQDSRMMPDPRMQDPRMMQDPRFQERYPDLRDVPVPAGRHQAYTSAYQESSIPGYTLSPSSQPAGFDYTMAQPRGYGGNTPPPTTRGGQSMYVQPGGYPAVSQAPQIMVDPRTGRQVLVPVTAGYAQEPPRTRHGRS